MHPDRPLAPAPVGVNYVAHCRGASIAKTRRELDWLYTRGFPRPLPDPVGHAPMWDRRAVDAWFDDLLPEHLRSRVEARQQEAWGAMLDARAERLAA